MVADSPGYPARAPRNLPETALLIDSGILIDGRYEVQGHLGDGGMGSVFKAHELELERTVAIKLLHADLLNAGEQRARFEREGKVLSTISHPNLLSCYRFGVWQGKPYIVMEYLEGKSLRQLLCGGAEDTLAPIDSGAMLLPVAEVTPFSWQRAVRIAISICEGMHYAHAHGIIHRDLKPNNIVLVETDGVEVVKVVDFGLARVLDDSTAGKKKQHLTMTGAVMGTLSYLSPEQCTGQRGDHRSDIYALGCMLYELIAGVAPFYSENPIAIMQKHAAEAPPKLPARLQVPVELNGILRKALAKKPEDRYQTMLEMQVDLDNLSNGRLEEIEVTVPKEARTKWQRTLPYVAAAAMALSCAGAVFWMNSDDGIAAVASMLTTRENRNNGTTLLLQKAKDLSKQRPAAAAKLLERALRINRIGTPDANTASILVNLAELRAATGRKQEAIVAAEEAITLLSAQICTRLEASQQEKDLTVRSCKILKDAGMFYAWEFRRFYEKHSHWYRNNPSMLDNKLLEQKTVRCDQSLQNLYRTGLKKNSSIKAAVLSLAEPPANCRDQHYRAHIKQLISEEEGESGNYDHADKEFEETRQILTSFVPPVPFALAELLALHADQLSRQNREAEAWTFFNQARDILRTNHLPASRGFIDLTAKEAADSLVHTRQRISEALYRAGDIAGAREQIVAAVKVSEPFLYEIGETRLISIYSQATNLLARNGQDDEALKMLEMGRRAGIARRQYRYGDRKLGTISYDPVEGAFHSLSGQLLLERGKFAQAEEEFNRALEILTEREDNGSETIAWTRRMAWCGLVECLIRSARAIDAVPRLQDLISNTTEATTSDRAMAHVLLARIYMYLGQEANATREVDKASKYDKKRSSGSGIAGLALMRDCELLSRFSRALQFEGKIPHPKHPDTVGPVSVRAGMDVASGDACLVTKRFEAARIEYSHALKLLNQSNKSATNELASVYASLYALEILTTTNKQSESAEQLLAKARSFQSGDARQTQRLSLELQRWEILSTLFNEDEEACDQALLNQERQWKEVPGSELEPAKSYYILSKFAKGEQRQRYLEKAIQIYERNQGANHEVVTALKKRLLRSPNAE